MALQTVDRKIPAFSLLFIYMFMISSSGVRCKICQDPQEVSVCPKSAYMWHERSKDFCVTKEEYHCLITEVNTIIECCMSAHNISAGHYPRYNRLKPEIQELECDKEHYMPISYSSNRFLDNGPHHCKYQKSKCNGAGMTTCTDGSTTQDRLCRCDYKNKFKTDFPGPICFPQDDNMCSMATSCMDKHKELNMMYECVNICSEGYYRPEMDCVPLPTSSVPPVVTITTEQEQGLTTEKSKEKDEIDRSEPTMQNDDNGTNIIIPFVGAAILAAIVAVFIYCHRIQRKHNMLEKIDPEFEMEKTCYNEELGADIIIRCKIKNVPKDFKEIIWKNGDDQNNISNPIDPKSHSQKYSIDNQNKTLTIKNADPNDAGWYACFIICHTKDAAVTCFIKCGMNGDEESVPIFPTESNGNATYVEIKEPKVELENKNLPVEYGEKTTLSCKISDVKKRDMYSIIWKRGKSSNDINELIDVSKNPAKYEDGNTLLTILDANDDDKGFYACFISCEINGNTFVFPKEEEKYSNNVARIHVKEKTAITHVESQNILNIQSAEHVSVGHNVHEIDIQVEREDEDS